MQKGSEEEKKSGDYQKKTSHLRDHTWRRCKDASSWNKVTNVKVQKKTKKTSKKEEKKVVSQGPSPPLGHPIDRDDNGPMTHHYPWPSSRHQMGRELSLSRPLKKYRERRNGRRRSRDRGEQEESSLHTFLSTLLCQNRLIQCVHKPWGMFLSKARERKAGDRIKNQTFRHESNDLFPLQGGDALHMFT